MSDYVLPAGALASIRALAREQAKVGQRAVSGDYVEARADRLIYAGLHRAFPEATVSDLAMVGEFSGDAPPVPRSIDKLQAWWSEETVARIAAHAAPKRARLVLAFLGGDPACLAIRAPRPVQSDLFVEGARA